MIDDMPEVVRVSRPHTRNAHIKGLLLVCQDANHEQHAVLKDPVRYGQLEPLEQRIAELEAERDELRDAYNQGMSDAAELLPDPDTVQELVEMFALIEPKPNHHTTKDKPISWHYELSISEKARLDSAIAQLQQEDSNGA